MVERSYSTTLRDMFGTPFSVRSRAILPMRIVEHPFIKNAKPFIGNAAYMALASGFIMTDILTLRMMLVGGYAALTCYHLVHANPLRIPLRWSALFVVVNIYKTAQIVLERWPLGLTEQDEALRSAFFDRLTPAQFVRLLALGERREVTDGTVLTVERQTCAHLFFVESGVATLSIDGGEVAKLGRGGFINDVAFQQGDGAGAYGTVQAAETMSVIMWEEAVIRELIQHDEKLASSLAHVLMTRLVEQLLQRYRLQQEEQYEKRQFEKHTREGRRADAKELHMREEDTDPSPAQTAHQSARTLSAQGDARWRLHTSETGNSFRDSLEGARTRAKENDGHALLATPTGTPAASSQVHSTGPGSSATPSAQVDGAGYSSQDRAAAAVSGRGDATSRSCDVVTGLSGIGSGDEPLVRPTPTLAQRSATGTAVGPASSG